MQIDEAVQQTQERLVLEGASMADLLSQFRPKVSPTLIGEPVWQRVLTRAECLPITMGASPFGFEIPLHEKDPIADLGVALASGTRSGLFFEDLARSQPEDKTARSLVHLFGEMEAEQSELCAIIGRKVMLEYDIGSAANEQRNEPGFFVRPGERPIQGSNGQTDDVSLITDALVSCVGWERRDKERENVRRAYLAQPKDTRMDSFGVFPSRARSIRLAIMGFKTKQEISRYLEALNWPGDTVAVRDVISRFERRTSISRSGANIDVLEDGIGPTLGLTLIVKQRYTKDSRYWLDGLTDWDPFLEALAHENIVVQPKLEALAEWVKKPEMLFAKSGHFLLLRGIHHIKLVVDGDGLTKAKAYVFMVLSSAV